MLNTFRLSWIFGIVCLLSALLMAGCAGSNTPYSPIKISAGKPDFAISVSPVTPVTINPPVSSGGKRGVGTNVANFTVTVTPINGFNGTVTLSSSVLEDTNYDFGEAFAPPSVTLDGGRSLTSVFTVTLLGGSGQTGNFSFGIVGTSGSISHSAAVPAQVTVQPRGSFTISISPNQSQTLYYYGNDDIAKKRGTPDEVSWTVTVTAVNGYTGPVNLTANNGGNGQLSTSFGNQSLTLSAANPTATTAFTISEQGDTLSDFGNFDYIITAANAADGLTTQTTAVVQVVNENT